MFLIKQISPVVAVVRPTEYNFNQIRYEKTGSVWALADDGGTAVKGLRFITTGCGQVLKYAPESAAFCAAQEDRWKHRRFIRAEPLTLQFGSPT